MTKPTTPDDEYVWLSDILFAQYQLGREHQRLSMTGKRSVGGEVTEAKQQIISRIQQNYIPRDKVKKYGEEKYDLGFSEGEDFIKQKIDTEYTPNSEVERLKREAALDEHDLVMDTWAFPGMGVIKWTRWSRKRREQLSNQEDN